MRHIICLTHIVYKDPESGELKHMSMQSNVTLKREDITFDDVRMTVARDHIECFKREDGLDPDSMVYVTCMAIHPNIIREYIHDIAGLN